MKALTVAFATLLTVPALLASEGAFAQERTVKITGFGVKSGVLRVFGVNSEAATAQTISRANFRLTRCILCSCFRKKFRKEFHQALNVRSYFPK